MMFDDSGGPKKHVLHGDKIPTGRGNFWGCPDPLKTLRVSVAVYAAKVFTE